MLPVLTLITLSASPAAAEPPQDEPPPLAIPVDGPAVAPPEMESVAPVSWRVGIYGGVGFVGLAGLVDVGVNAWFDRNTSVGLRAYATGMAIPTFVDYSQVGTELEVLRLRPLSARTRLMFSGGFGVAHFRIRETGNLLDAQIWPSISGALGWIWTRPGRVDHGLVMRAQGLMPSFTIGWQVGNRWPMADPKNPGRSWANPSPMPTTSGPTPPFRPPPPARPPPPPPRPKRPPRHHPPPPDR